MTDWRIDIHEIDHGDHKVYSYDFCGRTPTGAYLTDGEARAAALEEILSCGGDTAAYRTIQRTAEEIRADNRRATAWGTAVACR